MVYFQAFSIQFTEILKSGFLAESKAGITDPYWQAIIPEAPGTVSFFAHKNTMNLHLCYSSF
jgi:hypothetical protein